MTIYEHIQKSVDYIENNLDSCLSYSEAAIEAGMSVRSFYSMFWAVTGFTYKNYVRKRRLCESMKKLSDTKKSILEIALISEYESHESYTRAFKKEFKMTPSQYRKSRHSVEGLSPIILYRELYMGVIVKKIPEMRVLSYTGFSPEPEDKAHTRIGKWAKENGYGDLWGNKSNKPTRNFGHDTDEKGKGYGCENHDNYGYKVMMTISESDHLSPDDSDLTIEMIPSGKFLITGIEGNLEEGFDFIPEGWGKLGKMAREKGYTIKKGGRVFEEKLEPLKPENLRLDLYVEIE